MNFWFGPINDESAWMLENVHYAGSVPAAVQAVGCWREDGGLFGDKGKIIAACVFTVPPTRWSEDVWELARLVKLDDYKVSLTGLISLCCKKIRSMKCADLIVSFADPTHGHHGGIYQAASWNFHQKRNRTCDGLFVDGEYIPGRSLNHKFGTRSSAKLSSVISAKIEEHCDEGKYLYWKALSKNGYKKAEKLGLQRNAYPKPKFERIAVEELAEGLE